MIISCTTALKLNFFEHNQVHSAHHAKEQHEAFLGKEEAKSFDELSAEESKKKLLQLVDKKIDINGDGDVTSDELVNWMTQVVMGKYKRDWENKWALTNRSEGESLDFATFVVVIHGPERRRATTSAERQERLKALIERDERRWKAADVNKDSRLTKEEFFAFLYPQEHNHTREVVTQEVMEMIDTNKDNIITFLEYMNSYYPGYDEDKKEGIAIPRYVQEEEEHFLKALDTNGDQQLDRSEAYRVAHQDHLDIRSEVQELLKQADTDKNGVLSRQEIGDHYEVFVGSQATDYGSMRHDEL